MGSMVVIFIFMGLGVYAAMYFSRQRRLMRHLRKSPLRTIAAFSEGSAAKIMGRVRLVDVALEAPLSGRQCAYYEVVVEEGGGENGWNELAREARGVPFFVEDDTGRALVDPHDAVVVVVVDDDTGSDWGSGWGDEPTAAERALLERHGVNSKIWIFNRGLRYREGVLAPGDLVTVLGRGVRKPGAGGVHAPGGDRDVPAVRLRMQASDWQPLYISNDPSAFGRGR